MKKPKLRHRVCRCGCAKEFKPKRTTQYYLNPKHRNRALQRRLRQRAKQFYDMRADFNGNIS